MILCAELYTTPSPYALAAALYLDGYVTDTNVLVLPKRKRQEVLDTRRLHHFDHWDPHMHSEYRKLPATLNLEQYAVLDDSWAFNTFTMLREKFPGKLNAAARVAFVLWYEILLWGARSGGAQWYDQGYVVTERQLADQCGCGRTLVSKVIDAMLGAQLIHRKWTGSSYVGGSCYLPGPANHLESLLEKSNIGSGS